MEDDNLIETVDLLYDFKYTIPGSKKEPVVLKSGERFRLLEKKSENWYLVGSLKTDESFYVPVLYSEVVKLPPAKPALLPPRLPTKPKNLLEKLQNDLEIEPPAPPVLESSVQIELFKLLSNSHSKSISSKSNYSKPLTHTSDSHIDQIDKDNKVVGITYKKSKEENFDSLPKASARHHSDHTTDRQTHNEVSRTDPFPKRHSPLTTPSSPPSLPPTNKPHQSKSHHSPKALHPPKLSKTDLPPPLPPKPSSILQDNGFLSYKDATMDNDTLTDDNAQGIREAQSSTEDPPSSTHYEDAKLHLDFHNVSSWSYEESTHGGSLEVLKSVGEATKEEDSKSDKLILSKAGPLNRTKLTEGGRKLKKYWYCTYAVLEGTQLNFYKDQKTSAHKSKADLTLDLTDSFVLKGGTHNRQNIIQVITSTGSEYLLQSNDEQEVQGWFDVLSEASSTAAASVVDITATAAAAAGGGEEFMKTSSVTSEDTDSLNTSKGSLLTSHEGMRLRDKLKVWLGRRPSQDVLREKGIYKDVIFGSTLELICDREDSLIPSFVLHCMAQVELRGLDMDGIYRISGNMAEIQKLRMAVDSYGAYDLSLLDIHAVAGALKLFFRELQEPLVPTHHYHALLAAHSSVRRVEAIQSVVTSFPEVNYETLKSLLKHLLLVVSHSKSNRMQINNLSIIFGPTLLWPSESVDAGQLASSLMLRGQVVEALLNYYHSLFS